MLSVRSHMPRIAHALVVVLATLANLGCRDAESRGAPDGSRIDRADAVTVPAGASMVFTVDERVSSRTHADGAAFTATLGAEVASVDGRPAIAPGAMSRWVVERVPTRDGRALLTLHIRSIDVDGLSVRVTGVVTHAKLTVDEARGSNGAEPRPNDTPAIRTTVSLRRDPGAVTLPAGAQLTVRLTAPLVIS